MRNLNPEMYASFFNRKRPACIVVASITTYGHFKNGERVKPGCWNQIWEISRRSYLERKYGTFSVQTNFWSFQENDHIEKRFPLKFNYNYEKYNDVGWLVSISSPFTLPRKLVRQRNIRLRLHHQLLCVWALLNFFLPRHGFILHGIYPTREFWRNIKFENEDHLNVKVTKFKCRSLLKERCHAFLLHNEESLRWLSKFQSPRFEVCE